MKKTLLLFALVFGMTTFAQTGIKKTIVIMPDPSAANGKEKVTCKTVVHYSSDGCCHSYDVECDNGVSWTGQQLCNSACQWATLLGGARMTGPNPPTKGDPIKEKISLEIGTVSLNVVPETDDVSKMFKLNQMKQNAVFNITADTYIEVKEGDFNIRYTAGNYFVLGQSIRVLVYIE